MKVSNIFSKRNRVLLRELVITDFKLRYQGSVLGYLWSLLKPLLLFAIMYVVFGMLVRIGTVDHYAVYLLFGIVLWTFFAEATNQGMNSIVSRGDIIRKVNFPKYIIVLSTTISALVNLFLNLIIVGVLLMINGVHIGLYAPLILVFIVEIYIFALGLALFLSALNVKYRDTGHIWEIVMQAAFYATPIIYPLTVVIEKSHLAAQILMISPVAQAIQDARYALVTTETITPIQLSSNVFYIILPYVIAVAMLCVGALYFKKNAPYFAEKI